MLSQTRAILWAHFRTLLNFYSRGNTAGLWITLIASAVWYGMVATGAVTLAVLFADASKVELIRRVLPQGLLAVCL